MIFSTNILKSILFVGIQYGLFSLCSSFKFHNFRSTMSYIAPKWLPSHLYRKNNVYMDNLSLLPVYACTNQMPKVITVREFAIKQLYASEQDTSVNFPLFRSFLVKIWL